MKTIALLIICLAFYARPAFSQTDSLKWSRDTLITWSDFKGPVDKQSAFEAEVKAFVTYKYRYTYKNDVYHVTFKVESYFLRKKSWSIAWKQSDELLAHERLHNDINELFARKLFIAFNKQVYTANLRNEIKEIFDIEHNAATDMQLKYDEETNHSKNKIKQAEWVLYIQQQVDTLPPHY